jgi:hypothetical protein
VAVQQLVVAEQRRLPAVVVGQPPAQLDRGACIISHARLG